MGGGFGRMEEGTKSLGEVAEQEVKRAKRIVRNAGERLPTATLARLERATIDVECAQARLELATALRALTEEVARVLDRAGVDGDRDDADRKRARRRAREVVRAGEGERRDEDGDNEVQTQDHVRKHSANFSSARPGETCDETFDNLEAAIKTVQAREAAKGHTVQQVHKNFGVKESMAVLTCPDKRCTVDDVLYRVKMPKGVSGAVTLILTRSQHRCAPPAPGTSASNVVGGAVESAAGAARDQAQV